MSDYLRRAHDAELGWAAVLAMTDGEVESRLFQKVGWNEPPRRAPIDVAWVHHELRKTGVTLQLLWPKGSHMKSCWEANTSPPISSR